MTNESLSHASFGEIDNIDFEDDIKPETKYLMNQQTFARPREL